MPPFRYESSQDPRQSGTIADLMLRRGDIAAHAAQQNGAVWNGAAQNIGQMIGALPGQIALGKRAELQDKIGALQLQGAQQAAGDDQRLRSAYQQSGGDPAQMRALLASSGGLTLQHDQTLQQMERQQAEQHNAITSQIGLTLHDRLRPDDPTNNLQAMQEALDAAEHHKLITPEQAQQFGAMASADPTKIPEVAKSWAGLTAAGRAEIEKTITNKPGEVTTGRWDGAPIGTPQPEKDTEVELAKRAAAGDPIAIAAMKQLKPGPARTTEQDDQRYRDIVAFPAKATPDDLAWAKAYEHQKTLTVDRSASAAATRLATVQSQQNELQRRSQAFTEGQAGRKELTDKYEAPYLDAVEKAETLRSVIDAAKNGNQEAAALTPLLATLGVTTSEGVKRINMGEVAAVAGAGSLFERIKGRIGKFANGQPLPADLQNDIVKLADLLETSARKKYENGFNAVTTRYGLKDEQLRPAPAAPASSGPNLAGLTPGHARTFSEGPNKGETWTIGPDGQPAQVKK